MSTKPKPKRPPRPCRECEQSFVPIADAMHLCSPECRRLDALKRMRAFHADKMRDRLPSVSLDLSKKGRDVSFNPSQSVLPQTDVLPFVVTDSALENHKFVCVQYCDLLVLHRNNRNAPAVRKFVVETLNPARVAAGLREK